ncbi:RNA-binding protein (KH domain) [Desulfacinum hydrothermale DSM 13146]|uniref:RNA-binding protein KhpA n=1 Tax=Desulfacinum hydrothermale DSM 13146 TaxID=1121390 RepID=A0A1W1XFW3_9BACT|nr:KH domain-containing protein [Desulfacinum hydrothermale]SMC22865.1 RNA-binding protein (KH domain) [Desulfacinum hydrothermale DSM 13146]
MKELVEYLVKAMVDQPEKVLLAQRTQDESIFLELTVASDDMGKVIGRHGKTIDALRTVTQMAAASRDRRCRLELLG